MRKRILWTVGLCAIYRLGSFVVLPGIDATQLTGLQDQTRGGLMALLDMFSGGAFSNASIFALGIMPYISASIVIQLLTMVIPSFQKLARDGESGHNKINQYTRLLTVVVLIFQSFAYLTNLHYQIGPAILSTGVNIKNLHNMIFATPLKSYTTITQSIGRGIRKHSSKDKFTVFDLVDNLGKRKYGGTFYKQYKHRLSTSYYPEGYQVHESVLKC